MNLRRPLTDRRETFTQVRRGVRAENLLSKIFPSHPEKYGMEKTSNLRQLVEDHHQSEAHDFETYQYLEKRLSCVSSAINALHNSAKLGAITHEVLMQPRENVAKL